MMDRWCVVCGMVCGRVLCDTVLRYVTYVSVCEV